MPSPFFSLADFVVDHDASEFNALISKLGTVPALNNIYKLSRGRQGDVAYAASDTIGIFNAFWTRTATEADKLLTTISVVDPENPTPAEEEIIATLLPKYYSLWPSTKAAAIRLVIERSDAYLSKENAYLILTEISEKTVGDAGTMLGSEIYPALATYYIAEAKRFLSQNLREYALIGRITDQDDQPRPNVKITLKDDFLSDVRHFGGTTSNREGYYRIAFTAIDLEGTYDLDAVFSHPELVSTPVQQTLTYDPAQPKTPIVSNLTFAEIDTPSTVIDAPTTGPMTDELVTYLSSNNITRLSDIRKIGGLKNAVITDPDAASDPALLRLDALANLELVNPDLEKNKDLLDQGYTGISMIANTSRAAFMRKSAAVLDDDLEAAKIHYQAQALHRYAISQHAATHTLAPGRVGEAPAQHGSSCGCQECESAVSPLAYLADLLLFATSRVEHDETAIDITFLEERFRQAFGDLPASCSSLERTICQNRIAAEILRAYLVDHPPATEPAAALVASIRKYLIDAYRLLLTSIGTSYEEVRRIQHATPIERTRLKQRLGLLDVEEDDLLEEIFIDLSSPPANNTFEAKLEQVFGVRSSLRNVLTTPPDSKLAQWNEAYLTGRWTVEDHLNNPYQRKERAVIDPDIVTVDDLRFPKSPNPAFDLWKKRRDWLDGILNPLPTETFNPPKVDHSALERSVMVHGLPNPAVIVIAPGATFTYTNSPFSQVYTVASRTVVDGSVVLKVQEPVRADRANGTITIGVTSYVNAATQPYTSPDLADILNVLRTGSSYDGETIFPGDGWNEDFSDMVGQLRSRAVAIRAGDTAAISALRIDLCLLPAELLWMVKFIDDFTGYPTSVLHAHNNHSQEGWNELRDIVLTAFKRGATTVWCDEETSDGVVLGHHAFMPSMQTPKAGAWPPLVADDQPYLDPDLISTIELPEITALSNQFYSGSETTLEVLQERATELIALRLAVENAHSGGTDLPHLLAHVYDSLSLAPSAYAYCIDQLEGLGNPNTSASAISNITDTLRLTVDDFQFVMSLDGAGPHAARDLQRLYALLTRVQKVLDLWEDWVEDDAEVPYWRMYKARLPKWRSSAEERNEWLRALAQHSERPIIDADLIGPGDLRNPIAGNAAFDLWKARYQEMHSGGEWLNDISNALNAVSNTTQFDTFTQTWLHHAESGLHVLLEQREAGENIIPRLGQLNLTGAEFNFLIMARDAVGAMTVEEKTDVARILGQVTKRRQFHRYRSEEASEGVLHSTTFFKVSTSPVGIFPADPEYPLIPWLADYSDLSTWRRKLQGRSTQLEQSSKALLGKVAEVDGDMVLHLRDALVRASGRTARDLGNELLITLENTCCYKTNRVAQAIETLQQFLWKLRTGDLPEPFDLVELSAEDFDSAWTWMGSYANWRASMFVFLYPENVLLPSLLNKQTPAFKQVIEATRNNRRFSPREACVVAQDFQDYIQDISTLEVKCAAEVEVFLREDGCNDQNSAPHQYNITFAQSRTSHKSYYTFVDATHIDTSRQETFWIPIPRLETNARIFGCAIYYPEPQKFVYLFFRKEDPQAGNRFYALRYDLLNARWEEEPLEFQVDRDDLKIAIKTPATIYSDFNAEQFETNIKSIAVRQINRTNVVPTIAISLAKISGSAIGSYTFYWPMHDNGEEFKPRWDGDGWRLSIQGDQVLRGEVIDFVGVVLNENYIELDHSILSLRNNRSTHVTSEWSSWHAWLQQLLTANSILSQIASFIYGIKLNGIWFYRDTIGAQIQYQYDHEPEKFTEDVQISRDYVAYVQIFGNGDYIDTIHIPASLSQEAGIRVRQLLPFFDDRTCYLEYDRNGSLEHLTVEARIHLSTPLLLSASGNGSSAFNAESRMVCPVRSHAIDVSTNHPDRTGGNLVHQDISSISSTHAVFFTRFVKNYNASAPVNSTLSFTPNGLPLTLVLDSVPQIQREFNDAELALRRNLSAIHLEQNTHLNPRASDALHEAYYFVPLQIANQLCTNGHYLAALDWYRTIYDRNSAIEERKIWHGLVQEESGEAPAQRVADWYRDPLNPHAIARTRPHVYTRHTILNIAQCLLTYADAEYTADNSESVPRARELYEEALQLLELLKPEPPCPLDQAINDLSHYVELTPWRRTFNLMLEELQPLSGRDDFSDIVDEITDVLDGPGELDSKMASIRSIVDDALSEVTHPTFKDQLSDYPVITERRAEASMGRNSGGQAMEKLAKYSVNGFNKTLEQVTGKNAADLEGTNLPWLGKRGPGLENGYGKYIDVIRDGRVEAVNNQSEHDPGGSFLINSPFPDIWISGMPFQFCVVSNPVVEALLLKANLELFKIRNCMNIAGMVRELAPFAAPTDSTTGVPAIGAGGNLSIPSFSTVPPSPYRYRSIVERAKQLVAMAQQIEASFLNTLEKLDGERYSRMRAEQDMEVSKSNLKLQELKITEANSGADLAALQRDRAQIQSNGLQSMIDAGLNGYEQNSIDQIRLIATYQIALDMYHRAIEAANMAIQIAGAGGGITAPAQIATAGLAGVSGFVSLALQATASTAFTNLNRDLQINGIFASFERRKQEWEFQKSLAQQDIKIGDQQIKLAQDRVRIVGQEREIAGIQHTHAQTTLDFLKNKFTNAELYEWMSGILEDVYSWFLQEATSMALMAQRQLSFERQVDLPSFIRTDYWVVDVSSTGTSGLTDAGGTNRRGLTGSARLLKDLYDMDQYAFNTNSPKLQLAKTLSLGEIAPEELISLRRNGIARFLTTQDQFDRDYPGHYLRLIKKINITVIALNPPSKGIRATLTNGGVSRVITGGTILQERTINRSPEQIALSGGVSDYGIFQLRGEGEFLDPFEGCGVDTSWEFRMEKAANPFDFGSIADVLITIEYEALNSFTHRANVVSRLNNEPARSALAISLKNNLPDQWFDLHNPEQAAEPYASSFRINAGDLAPNMGDGLLTDRILAYVVMKDGNNFHHGLTLQHNDMSSGERSFSGGFAQFDTLAGAPGGPIGDWHIKFSADASGGNAFDMVEVEDVLLVINYSSNRIPYSI